MTCGIKVYILPVIGNLESQYSTFQVDVYKYLSKLALSFIHC